MKIIKTLMLPVIVLSFLVGCTITHKFGPYYGKVVDKETNEPIEGAAVLIRFSTERYTPGGFVGKHADAVEMMTDANGEFKMPARRIIRPRVPHRWRPYGYVHVFKPGYGFYPDHKGTSPMFMPNGTLPSNEYVTIKLPRLKTIEERRINLRHVDPPNVPNEKMRNLLRLESIERVNIGLTP